MLLPCVVYIVPASVFHWLILSKAASHFQMFFCLAYIGFVCLTFERAAASVRVLLDAHWYGSQHHPTRLIASLLNELPLLVETDEIVEYLQDRLSHNLGIERLVLYLSAEESAVDNLGTIRAFGADVDCAALRSLLGKSVVDNFIADGQLIIPTEQVSGELRSWLKENGFRFMMPMFSKSRTIGLILLGNLKHGRDYSSEHLQALHYFVVQVSLVFDRAQVVKNNVDIIRDKNQQKLLVLKRMSSSIAHEMRTPLSLIRLSADKLSRVLPEMMDSGEASSGLNADFKSILLDTPERIVRAVDQANNVIDLLLNNIREDALDKSKFSRFSAYHCIEDALSSYAYQGDEYDRVTFTQEGDIEILGIYDLMVFVIFNLLKNAFYSLLAAQKGNINIVLTDEAIVFEDTGTGIKEDDLNQIFNEFYSTKQGGTGTGLSFCRRTIESFGGQMRCESVYGDYTRFYLEFANNNNKDVAAQADRQSSLLL